MVLVHNGKALRRNNKVMMYKPYRLMWGFHQAQMDGLVSAYDYVYSSIASGYTDPTKDGGTYDGAYAKYYKSGCRWLIIDLQPLGITKPQASKVITKVTNDNPLLLSFIVADELDREITVVDDIATRARICLPVDAERQAALHIMDATIAQIDEHISEVVGVSVVDPPKTEAEKQMVVKVIHDWILQKSDFVAIDTTSYWQTTAFAPLSSALDADVADPARRESQCSGIASAMQLMCQRYGINCIYVSGNIGGGTADNHAWNIIDFSHAPGMYSIDHADWYGLDVTFDEHASDGELIIDGEAVSPWEFFLSSDAVYHDTRTAAINGKIHSLTRKNSLLGYPVEYASANANLTEIDTTFWNKRRKTK